MENMILSSEEVNDLSKEKSIWIRRLVATVRDRERERDEALLGSASGTQVCPVCGLDKPHHHNQGHGELIGKDAAYSIMCQLWGCKTIAAQTDILHAAFWSITRDHDELQRQLSEARKALIEVQKASDGNVTITVKRINQVVRKAIDAVSEKEPHDQR